MAFSFTTHVRNAGQWWRNLYVSDIVEAGGGPITVQSYLALVWTAPGEVQAGSALLNPWVEYEATATNTRNEDGDYHVVVRFDLTQPWSPGGAVHVMGVSGNLAGDATKYLESVNVYVDELP